MADKFIKIQFKADTDALRAGLDSADRDVQSFGDRIGEWGKKAAAAFAVVAAAAAAYAGKLAIDGVKAAIADEAAQLKLATTLRNVAGATDEAVAATEDFITRTQLATGVADDKLRPALDRLVRSGLSVSQAQETLTLALDISAGSGKGLEAVANALGKAYEGNTTSLGKLGVGLSSAELKAMSFEQITAQLGNTFRDQASLQADTFAGKMARVRVAFDEAKETLGTALLPVIEQFADYLIKTVIPAVQKWIDENGPKLVKVLTEFVIPAIASTVSALATITEWISDNAEVIKSVGTILLAGLAAYKVTTTIAAMVTALGTLAAAYTGVATAATAAGTATTVASGAAARAAGAAGGFAALTSTLAPLLAALAAIVVVFEKIATNPRIRSLVENQNVRDVLPGLGLTGTTNYDRPRTVTVAQGPESFERMGLGAAQTAQAAAKIVVPTIDDVITEATKTAAQVQADLDRQQILGMQKEIAKTQSGITGVLEKLDAFAAQQLIERFPMYDRASTGAVINFNAPVVSDPESIARLIDDALTQSAARTGNYTSLGLAPTSLPAASL